MTDPYLKPPPADGSLFLKPEERPDPYPRTSDVREMRQRANRETQGFYDYWDGKRCGGLLPARLDLDPVEMVTWLPGLQLIDVFHNPRRLKYRLVGEVDVESRGFNPTGRWLEDGCIGISKEDVFFNYNSCIDQKVMVFDWGEYPCGSGFMQSQETLFLPLASDGDIVDMVITFAVVKRL